MKKSCTKCGEEKEIDCFYPFKNGLFGRRAWCIDCFKKVSKENRDRYKYLKVA